MKLKTTTHLVLVRIALLLFVLAIQSQCNPASKSESNSGVPASGIEETLTASTPTMQLLSPSETGIDFSNSIVESEDNNPANNMYFYNGAGVCVGDFNNDDLTDVYFVNSYGKNKLYMNQGNLKFVDKTDEAGVASSEGYECAASVADVNSDGFLDIIVLRSGFVRSDQRSSKLFINTPSNPGHFTEQSAAFGLDNKSAATGAVFFDYDNDGDLDMYLLNHPENQNLTNALLLKNTPAGNVADLEPKAEYDSDYLYRNDGYVNSGSSPKVMKYSDVSKAAGIHNLGFGLSVAASDLNNDGYLDLYVANDFIQPDNVFINNKKGGFDDKINYSFKHNSMASMGSELVDFDNDGLIDIFTVDMLPDKNYRQKTSKTTGSLSRYLSVTQSGLLEPVARNTLQRNNGNGTFSEMACLAGIYKTDWSWSCLFVDMDNDGLKDLYITNGFKKDINDRDLQDFVLPEFNKKQKTQKISHDELSALLEKFPIYKPRNYFFRNKNAWQFEDVTGKWASVPASWSCGAAWADLDNDGDLDLLVNNLEEPAFVYKNLAREQNLGNYLQIKLKGSSLNPFAVGASVQIEYQGQKQYQEIMPNRGAFSASELLAHFGLGKVQTVDRLTVRWPDGKTQKLENVPVNQRLTLQYENASGYVASLFSKPTGTPLFKDISAQLNLKYTHKENVFTDFERWPLNLIKQSNFGPLIASGDLNGDGLDDFFLGNAFDQPAAIYLQNKAGAFSPSSVKLLEGFKNYEDNGALFFDADGDRDLDIFVTSGGPEASADIAWQPRLYINDGKGEFSNGTADRLPTVREIGLRAAAFDYDKDGDLDLFVGGRTKPNAWPLAPRSVVLQNNQGKFTDVTATVGGGFTNCGMVTDLSWNDVNGDGQMELLVVGEWMNVCVFVFENNTLKNVSSKFGLENSTGLWNRILCQDMDGDGDLDLVTGNLGTNSRLRAPMHCYASDFDKNGILDPVVAWEETGKIYPLMQKDVLVKQMPFLKKKFLYAKDYAKSTVEELFTPEAIKASYQLTCNELETCWWENNGGKFAKRQLPVPAQLSAVQGILARDFNGDGKMDLLLAGNKYGFDFETNNSDASVGALLIGDGTGNFEWMDNLKTGFWADRDARDLAIIRRANGKSLVLVSNNDSKPQFFELN